MAVQSEIVSLAKLAEIITLGGQTEIVSVAETYMSTTYHVGRIILGLA